ncbi:MAG: hypothetical protein AB7T49_19180 [Oligoflexales bacterium]
MAEGCGRWHKAEKKQFYWVARGSVFDTEGDCQQIS